MNLTERQIEDLGTLNLQRERVRAWVSRMIDACEHMKLPDKPLDMQRCVRLAEAIDKTLIQIYRPFPTPRAAPKPRVPAPTTTPVETRQPARTPVRPAAAAQPAPPISAAPAEPVLPHGSNPTTRLKTALSASASSSPAIPALPARAALPGLPRPASPNLVKALNTETTAPP